MVLNPMPEYNKLYTSWRSAVSKPTSKLRLTSILLVSALILVGCDKDASTEDITNTHIANHNGEVAEIFSGCYSVSHDEPAQIKISEQQGALVMQMKEPERAKRVWDDPEPLEVVDSQQAQKYFSIDPNNLDALIARPDRVFVLAHVKSAYANIDPLLDSEYLTYIYKGGNTIYKVECDEVNTDILADPHSNIVIENVAK